MDDADQLYSWYKDPVTRAASIHTETMSRADYLLWLEPWLQRDDRRLFIAEFADEPVGTIRLEFGDEVEFGISVAPEHRGKGLAAAIVLAAMPPQGMIGYVKWFNRASQAMMRSAGFRLERTGELQLWRHPGQSISISNRSSTDAAVDGVAFIGPAAQTPAA